MLTLGRPLAATGLLIGVIGVTGFWLFATIAGLEAAATERDAKVELLAGLLARKSAVAGRQPESSGHRLAFVAESGTQAAAAVDAMVRATVLDAGGSVLSSRAEAKSERTPGGNRIEVEAVVEGRVEAIQKILYRFERGFPMVFVEHLALRAAEASRAAGTDPNAPLLHETLTLDAYWDRAPR